MRRAKCVFDTRVNGPNTGCKCRTAPNKNSGITGYLVAKNCPANTFYVDLDDGNYNGNSGYAKILESDGKISGYAYLNKKFVSVTEIKDVTKEIKSSGGNASTPIQEPAEDLKLATDQTSRTSSGFDNNLNTLIKKRRNFRGFVANTRVFGAPFQFLDTTDLRPIKGLDIGREYYENILIEAPLVYFVPGLPRYMGQIDEQSQKLLENYSQSVKRSEEVSEEIMKKVFKVSGKYFSFFPAFYEYMRYVNLLCRSCAVFMGIADKTVPYSNNQKYKDYDWSKFVNIFTDENTAKSNENRGSKGSIFELDLFGLPSSIGEYVQNEVLGDFNYVKFYADASMNVSESTSNSTKDPMVKGYFSSASGLAKDILFLSSGNRGNGTASKAFANLQKYLGDTLTNLDTDALGNLGSIINMAGDVVMGSNVVFPELYDDSTRSTSYNVSITLKSPYNDPESRFLNIIVPLMFIYGLSYPRQLDSNNYESPFMIKAFFPGMATCEMGIVDSLSVEQVNESRGIDGVASEVRVNIGIKDLYKQLSITKTTMPGRFLSNTGLIEHLMVTCGVDITVPNLQLRAETIVATFENVVKDFGVGVERDILTQVRVGLNSIVDKFIGALSTRGGI